MYSLLRKLTHAASQRIERLIESHADRVLFQLGSLHASTVARESQHIRDSGFRCYSQWDEDGIIEFLVQRVPIAEESFVEFGVESYKEANTRFLLEHRHWRGLILDGGTSHIERCASMWRFDLTPVRAFVTAENINNLLSSAGFVGDIGLLSIDVDGNDYWIWKSVEVVQPRIVVIEYNAAFGPERAVTIPYAADFVRSRAHYSNLYWGASLRALAELGEAKGYALVGTNRAGNNAFFVRRDVLPHSIPVVDVRTAFTDSRFRESRDPKGALTFLTGEARLRAMNELPLVDVSTSETIQVHDLLV